MFVTESMIDEMIAGYGIPQAADFNFDVSHVELQRIRSSQKNGRNHDVTMYIFKGEKVVVIAKPFYPEGMYRAPSGGLNPGESFHDGINRETMEETGCRITLQRFLLRTSVRFVCESEFIEWRSFVFLAEYSSGNFQFTDRREIKEVRLVRLDEFERFSQIMRASAVGGLHYRAALHDTVVGLL